MGSDRISFPITPSSLSLLNSLLSIPCHFFPRFGSLFDFLIFVTCSHWFVDDREKRFVIAYHVTCVGLTVCTIARRTDGCYPKPLIPSPLPFRCMCLSWPPSRSGYCLFYSLKGFWSILSISKKDKKPQNRYFGCNFREQRDPVWEQREECIWSWCCVSRRACLVIVGGTHTQSHIVYLITQWFGKYFSLWSCITGQRFDSLLASIISVSSFVSRKRGKSASKSSGNENWTPSVNISVSIRASYIRVKFARYKRRGVFLLPANLFLFFSSFCIMMEIEKKEWKVEGRSALRTFFFYQIFQQE